MISEPEPTLVMPTTRPPDGAEQDGGERPHLDTGQRGPAAVDRAAHAGPGGGTAARVIAHAEEGAHNQAGDRQQERDAERDLHRVLQRLAVAERLVDEYAGEGGRHAAQAEPAHQTPIHAAVSDVNEGADRLHHGARDQVAGDRGERRNAEEDHEYGRHQGAAAHAGQADDDADAETGRGQCPVHLPSIPTCQGVLSAGQAVLPVTKGHCAGAGVRRPFADRRDGGRFWSAAGREEASVAEILVLGPVEVRHGGRTLVFSRQQERFILGVLALEVGRPVATDRLIDLLWGDEPPAECARCAANAGVGAADGVDLVAA